MGTSLTAETPQSAGRPSRRRPIPGHGRQDRDNNNERPQRQQTNFSSSLRCALCQSSVEDHVTIHVCLLSPLRLEPIPRPGLHASKRRRWSSILTSSLRLCLWCSRKIASCCAALRRRPSITASMNRRKTDRRFVSVGICRAEEEACIVVVISPSAPVSACASPLGSSLLSCHNSLRPR
jgi:hypothetical protein